MECLLKDQSNQICYNWMAPIRPYVIRILFVWFSLSVFLLPLNSVIADLSLSENGFSMPDIYESGLFDGENKDQFLIIFDLLQKIGINISYGENGETVFSMVDKSLKSIINDLSSGNSQGFLTVPLINETLASLGISMDQVVISPEEVNDQMKAIEAYNETYGINMVNGRTF